MTYCDPVTIFNKIENFTDNRKIIIPALEKQIGIEIINPTDFSGIPSTFWSQILFANSKEDEYNIWNVFEASIRYAEDKTEENRNTFITAYNIAYNDHGKSMYICNTLYNTCIYISSNHKSSYKPNT